MKSIIRLSKKQVILGLSLLALLTVGSTTAKADEVTFEGFTTGCFGLGCTPGATASIGGLFFDTSNFRGLTVNGFLPLGNNGVPGANFNNLGSLALGEPGRTYDTPFTLLVNFTTPEVNGNPATFTAVLQGTVSSHEGGVFVDFDNTPQFFNFDVGCRFGPGICATGSFSLSVNDIALHTDSIVPITGQIRGAQQQSPVPEPATMLLLGTGIIGVSATLRRRKSRTPKLNE